MKKRFFAVLMVIAVVPLIWGSGMVFAKPNYNVYKPAPYVQNNVVSQSKSNVIELVMDYSGSMSGWINTAKSTMQRILPQIPDSTQVGLRVFGQKVQNKTTTVNSNNLFTNINSVLMNSVGVFASVTGVYACEATEQISPISSKNTASLIAGMNSTPLGGSTPLTLALEKTVYSDFAGLPVTYKKKIVLVTDGGENCNKNPCDFVKNLAASRKDIQIDVIILGSDTNLKCLSDATGGNFYNINSKADFPTALEVTFETKPASAMKNSAVNAVQHLPETQDNQGFHYKFLSE